MNKWAEQMKARTHRFMVDVIKLVQGIPDRTETRRVKDQMIGAACGIDGNYHSACRARSHKEFTAVLRTVLIEAAEAEEWLDVIHDAKLARGDELRRLRVESQELRAIFAKAVLTAKRKTRAATRTSRVSMAKELGRFCIYTIVHGDLLKKGLPAGRHRDVRRNEAVGGRPEVVE